MTVKSLVEKVTKSGLSAQNQDECLTYLERLVLGSPVGSLRTSGILAAREKCS